MPIKIRRRHRPCLNRQKADEAVVDAEVKQLQPNRVCGFGIVPYDGYVYGASFGMMKQAGGIFFADKLRRYDLARIKVESGPHSQSYRALVEQIYSSRKGLQGVEVGQEIAFVGCPSHWGQRILKAGDTALIFLCTISGRLYEDAWRGHMVLEEIDGVCHASYQQPELWLGETVPASIKSNARQDPKHPDSTAIRFDVLEAYLRDLIASTDGAA